MKKVVFLDSSTHKEVIFGEFSEFYTCQKQRNKGRKWKMNLMIGLLQMVVKLVGNDKSSCSISAILLKVDRDVVFK